VAKSLGGPRWEGHRFAVPHVRLLPRLRRRLPPGSVSRLLRRPHDREILWLAGPAFGALVAEPLFLLADSAIVGHLGTAQQAGLGSPGQR
jgi:hypothetical protein